jgi:ubiquinone/menaquinone biosynthesis C-methylase UbiE
MCAWSLAGLDLSDISLEMARQRLAGRIAAGTAEVVKGDAMALTWEDGRFSVVASMNCVKFVPEPLQAVREMYRVLRPGGRAFLTVTPQAKAAVGTGKAPAGPPASPKCTLIAALGCVCGR